MEERAVLPHPKAGSPGPRCCDEGTRPSAARSPSTDPGLQSPSASSSLISLSLILTLVSSRFDIEDRKGLEIVLLTALMTFIDAKDADPSASLVSPTAETPSGSSSIARMMSASVIPSTPSSNGGVVAEAPPRPPPKPAPKTGLDRIAEMQAVGGGDYNEISVGEEGSVEDYAQYCSNLLSVSHFYTLFLWVLMLILQPRTTPCFSFLLSHRRRRPSPKSYTSSRKQSASDTKQVRPPIRVAVPQF